MENKLSDITFFAGPLAKDDDVFGRDIDDPNTETGWVKRAPFEEFLANDNLDPLTPDPGDRAEEDDSLTVTRESIAYQMDMWHIGARERKYLATLHEKVNSAVLTAIPDLEFDLVAEGVYTFEAVLHVSAGGSGGHQYRVAGTDGLTAAAINYYVQAQSSTSAPTIGTRITDLGSTAAGVTSATSGICIIRGTIVVNAAGTLVLQFAQNASNGTPSQILVGSFLEVVRVA